MRLRGANKYGWSPQPIVKLKYLPKYILIKLSRTRATQLDDLGEGVVPIEPISTNYKIKVYTKEGKACQRTIKRLQFPLTAAYAFTDYWAQGQTIPYVIVDVASPPTGMLSLFNLYVALSQVLAGTPFTYCEILTASFSNAGMTNSYLMTILGNFGC